MMGSKMASASRVVQRTTFESQCSPSTVGYTLSGLFDKCFYFQLCVCDVLVSGGRQRYHSQGCRKYQMPLKVQAVVSCPEVVKPHAPLIRFPDRRDNPKLSASETLRSSGLPSHSSIISQHSKGSISPDLLVHPGPPDTAEILKTLPQKYRRKPISQEEMEFIQRGGPE
ncbi:28S ribosomal protein S36 [Cricetulus griseus]|nr:28S ribosomal protein S36 [Cricetulus griseus]